LADERTGTSVAGAQHATIWSMHYLRAVAALGVVLFHCLGDAGWGFNLGAAGIHLFFTLSGFMMWSIAGERDIRPLAFLLGRIRRVVPLYWIATAVAVGSTYVVPGFFYQSTRDVPIILKSLLFIPQFGVDGGVFPVLFQGWTLQYEMFFYALFALCLLAPVRARVTLLCVAFLGLAALGMMFKPQSPLWHTYTDPICLEFLAGALVARCGWRIASPLWATCGAIGAGIAFCLSDHYESSLGEIAPLILAVTAASLIVALLSLERAGRMPHNRILRLLGEASFAIYLFQDVGFALASPIMATANPLARALVYALSAVVTGVFIHLTLEKPLTARIKRFRRAAAWPVNPQPAMAER
jgi:exopolysaccharide production protein ExoZ